MEYKFINEGKEHLHTLDGKPLLGTSTVCKIIAKPLTWWASGMAVEKFGWLNPKKFSAEAIQEALEDGYSRVTKLSIAEYGKLLQEAYAAHSVKLKDSAVGGTDLHAELEKYVKFCITGKNGKPHGSDPTQVEQVNRFADWAKKNIKRFLFSELHIYSEKYWLGGIADAGAELMNGEYAIIDFKSAKEAYFDHFVQIALYNVQLSENKGGFDKDGNKTFTLDKPISQYLVVPFGGEPLTPKFRADVSQFQEAALAALTLYKHSTQYES